MTLDYPAASRWIAYNIPRGGAWPQSNFDGSDAECVSSIKKPGRLTYDEADDVHQYAAKAIGNYVRQSSIPRLDDLRQRVWWDSMGLGSIGDPYGDRTLPVGFDYPPMVDIEFVAFLQSDILTRFPNWRIHHAEANDARHLALAIYPDAVSVGDNVYHDDFSIAIGHWRQGILRHREPKDGPLRRQLNTLKSHICSKSRGHWKRSAPVVVMAFDNCEGDSSEQTIWIVTRGGRYDREGILAPHSWDESYPIMNSGRIGYKDRQSSPSGLWLRQIVVSTQESHQIRLTRPESKNERVDVTVSDFVRDADLIRLE